jgi:hypothetical protein
MTSCESCLDCNRKFCFCILLDLSTFVLAGLCERDYVVPGVTSFSCPRFIFFSLYLFAASRLQL